MRTLLATAAAGLAFAGCGGSDEPTAASPSPMASATEAPREASAGPAKVQIKGFAFKPRKLTVRAGEEVSWTDEDASNHTVTFSKGPGDLGNVDQGDEVSATFEKPGTYAYVCAYHPSMTASVTVR